MNGPKSVEVAFDALAHIGTAMALCDQLVLLNVNATELSYVFNALGAARSSLIAIYHSQGGKNA